MSIPKKNKTVKINQRATPPTSGNPHTILNDIQAFANPVAAINMYLTFHDPSFLKMGAITLLMDIMETLSGEISVYNKDGSVKDNAMGEEDAILDLLVDIPLAAAGVMGGLLTGEGMLAPEDGMSGMGEMEIPGADMLTEDMMPTESVIPTESSVAVDGISSLTADGVMDGGATGDIMNIDIGNQGVLNLDGIIDAISNAPDAQTALDNISGLIDQIQQGLLSEEQMNKINNLLDDYMDELGTEDENANDLIGSP